MESRTRLQTFRASSQGTGRANNEDRVLVDETLGLFAIADGNGGAPGGEVAAQVGLDAVAKYIRQLRHEFPETEVAPRHLRKAVESASAAVFSEATRRDNLWGMGTALTVMQITDRHAVVAHVGHGRLYRVRDGLVHQLTHDHTLAAELERRGQLEETAVHTHVGRNVLLRNVGPERSVLVDTHSFSLLDGDTYILGSNGVGVAVPGAAPSFWLKRDPAAALVRSANALVQDDVSAIVVRVHGPTDDVAFRSEEVLRRLGPFADMSESGLAHLRAAGRRQEVVAGERLWSAGDAVDRLVVVLKGSLRSTKGRLVEPIRAGEAIGVTTLLGPRAARGDLVADTDATLFVLTAKALGAACRRRHSFAVALLAGLGAAQTARLERGVDDHEGW